MLPPHHVWTLQAGTSCTVFYSCCRYLSELEMKLYLAAEDVDIALEDDSSRALQRIPASVQDIVHLEVRSGMASLEMDEWTLHCREIGMALDCAHQMASAIARSLVHIHLRAQLHSMATLPAAWPAWSLLKAS